MPSPSAPAPPRERGKHAELLRGAVGAVVVRWHDIERELARQLGERLLLGATRAPALLGEPHEIEACGVEPRDLVEDLRVEARPGNAGVRWIRYLPTEEEAL